MKSQRLFNSNGCWLTRGDLLEALKAVGASDCKILYMHSALSFGTPNPELKRSALLQALYETLQELGVETLCVPTFTFSFCNGDVYDVEKTRSHMGALNEYIRQRPEAIRSIDPLMSVAMVGRDRDLVENLGHDSVGKNSTFDRLCNKDGVKFLFLGVDLGDCFTYMHYLEWLAQVPYRYQRNFTGTIIENGTSVEDTYSLFVRYNNVTANEASYTYGKMLTARGLQQTVPFGDTTIGCVSEPDAKKLYLALLNDNPDYFIHECFSEIVPDPTFFPRKMVAL